MPFFSVIIPLYNKDNFVDNTIKSVLGQSFTDFELIIINDGSTDNSEAKVLQFDDSRIRYFSKKNEGVAATRNFGIEKAASGYISFLDADDYWYPEFLEVMHDHIVKLPEQKVFSCAITIETDASSFPAQYSIEKTGDYEIVDYFDASMKKSVLWTSGVVIHQSVFKEVGAFDPMVKKGEDTELWIRIGLRFPIVFIWQIMAKYVYHDQSVSRNYNYFFDDYTFKKHEHSEQQNPKLKKIMDLNRFSAIIKCLVTGDRKTAASLYKQIDPKNLNWRRKILLRLPSGVLQLLINLKAFGVTYGVGNSVFR
jgi:glycosyltransferase involved in cell wall biosynthesis